MPIVNLTTSYLGIIPPNDPVVTFVSATGSSITVNITNPNEYSVKAYYGHTNPNPILNTTISANSNQNVTVSGLTVGTNYTIYVYLENTENNSTSTTVSVLASTPAELYAFTSHMFTNAGATGINGPTLSQCQGAYSSTSWASNSNFFTVTGSFSGIQIWTVPATGNYRINANGARGGNNSGYSRTGGNGARMQGDFALNQGDKIKIMVGQMGTDISSTCDGTGGGGGTWVTTELNTQLVVAAGGGGAGTSSNGSQGSNSSGSNVAGTFGTTACSDVNRGYGGASTTNNSTNPWYPNAEAYSFTNGGRGGTNPRTSGFNGGFGGGGTGGLGGGGGGGHSGGNGGSLTSCDCTQATGGSGGLSFNSGSNQVNSSGNNSGHGFVTITKL
jgi:hypothetical protein